MSEKRKEFSTANSFARKRDNRAQVNQDRMGRCEDQQLNIDLVNKVTRIH